MTQTSLAPTLLRQFDLARRLADHHLAGLSEAEVLWRPAARGLHVWRDGEGWRADWPETETYDLGPASIAWLGWHMGFWLTMALDRNFGPGTASRDSIAFPGPAALPGWLAGLLDQWRAAVAGLDDAALAAPGQWPMPGRPLADIVAWANAELMKSAAEIGYARFLHAVSRSGTAAPATP